MTKFKWIIIVLLVILLLFSAESHQTHMFVREGEEVTLPCANTEPGQPHCHLTTWIHESVDAKEVKLISHGKGAGIKVNLTKECSLLMKDIQAQEAGRYTCRQYDSWGQEQPRNTLISLSVVSLSEDTNSLGEELNCSVSTNLRCSTVAVKWLEKDTAVAETYPHLRVYKSKCRSSVQVQKSLITNLSRQQLTCEVTYYNNKYRYSFGAEGQEETTVIPLTTTEVQSTKNWNDTQNKATSQEEQSRLGGSNEKRDSVEDRTAPGLERWWWAVMAATVVSFTAVVIFVIWRRFKGKPLEPSSAPSAEEGVSYASISFSQSHEKTGIRASEETVTYSTVRSAASVDPAQLYASVNK